MEKLHLKLLLSGVKWQITANKKEKIKIFSELMKMLRMKAEKNEIKFFSPSLRFFSKECQWLMNVVKRMSN